MFEVIFPIMYLKTQEWYNTDFVLLLRHQQSQKKYYKLIHKQSTLKNKANKPGDFLMNTYLSIQG